MSGICGVVRFDNKPIENKYIFKMLKVMNNCGNDDERVWVSRNIGFGHKMLFTTPESLYEKQPLITNDNNLVLTADVRIDNRPELIKILECDYVTNKIYTDSDLILLAYQKWGEEFPKYLVGDYSFAIWDNNKKQLFCARSPIGIKPFYYYMDTNLFIFASEISVIQDMIVQTNRLNISAVKSLTNEYVLPCDETCFTHIMRLKPANYMTIKEKKIDFKCFWFPENIIINKHISFEEAKVKFIDIMKQAIQSRLRTAYPVGCEISGGLDSSTVFTLAKGLVCNQKLSALSSYYGDLNCDESQYIQEITEKFNTKPLINHADKLDYKHEYSLFKYYKITSSWPSNGSFLDNIGIYKIAQKNKIRVILSGQGGDHVATGNLYILADYLKSFRLIRLYNEMKIQQFSWKIFKNYALLPIIPKSLKKIIKFLLGMKENNLLSQTDFCNKNSYNISSYAQNFDFRVITGLAVSTWSDSSPSAISGNFNIEYRHPFFDQRVIEFMLSLPPNYKFNDGKTKIILRESLKNELPESIYRRNDKAEFTSVIIKQMKDILKKSSNNFENLIKFNIINKDHIKQYNLFKSLEERSVDENRYFWNFYRTEEWIKFNKLREKNGK